MLGKTPLVKFVTDGRLYEPPPTRPADFICVFGDLLAGPTAYPEGGTLEFDALLTLPDGSRLCATYAHLDYPVHPEAGDETGHMVLLRGVAAQQVPAGTRITSREIDR